MSYEVIIVLGVIILALILFVAEVIPVDQTAILVMVVLMISGIITPGEAVSGFSNSATLTILALLIISSGLEQTGFVNLMADWMVSRVGQSQWKALSFIMITTAVLSAFINNTAVVGIFLPVMIRISKNTDLSISKLLIPLSFSAMVGGASTIMGSSTNLLVNSIADDYEVATFSLFEFTHLGLILLVVFMAYMLLVGCKIIPNRRKMEGELTEEYALKEYLTEFVVEEASPLIDKKIEESDLVDEDTEVIEIHRGDGSIWLPEEIEKLKVNDSLVIKSDLEKIVNLAKTKGVKLHSEREFKDQVLTSDESILFEALISPNSSLIDKKIIDVNFRKEYNAIPLAVRRAGKTKHENLREFKLQFGDILLIEAKRQTMQNFYTRPDFIIMHRISEEEIPKMQSEGIKTWLSVGIILIVVALTLLQVFPILVSAWVGVALMFLTGCLTLKRAYQSVHWNVIFLLAGLIPLGIAMEKSGVVDLLSQNLAFFMQEFSVYGTVATLFVVSMLLTSIVSNNVTVVLLTPLAIELAGSLTMDQQVVILAVLFGANTSFLTPVGYQTNTMIFEPGNYKFGDFIKVGGILCLIFWAITTVAIPHLF